MKSYESIVFSPVFSSFSTTTSTKVPYGSSTYETPSFKKLICRVKKANQAYNTSFLQFNSQSIMISYNEHLVSTVFRYNNLYTFCIYFEHKACFDILVLWVDGWVMVFNVTFINISVISWRSVLLVDETGENHRPAASHWQTLSHTVVSNTPRLSGIRTHNLVVIGTDCI